MLGGGWAPHPPPLRERTLDVIADLVTVTGSVVRAGVLEGAQIAVAEGGPGRPPADGFTIDPAPPHASALGRVLLAFSPAEVVDDVLAAVRAADASPSPERLRRLLSTTRLARLSVCRTEDGTRCTVAVPVFGIGGGLLTALEATATDPRSGYEAVRGALLVAAGSLSRELATAHSPATGSDGAGGEERAGGAEPGRGSPPGCPRVTLAARAPPSSGRTRGSHCPPVSWPTAPAPRPDIPHPGRPPGRAVREPARPGVPTAGGNPRSSARRERAAPGHRR